MQVIENVNIEKISLNFELYLNKIKNNKNTIFITDNNENLAVIQNISEYNKNQDAINLLKLISIGENDLKKGKVLDFDEFFSELSELL